MFVDRIWLVANENDISIRGVRASRNLTRILKTQTIATIVHSQALTPNTIKY